MKVRELKRILKKVEDDCEIRVDNNEHGFYSLDAIEIFTDNFDEKVVNLISSSED